MSPTLDEGPRSFSLQAAKSLQYVLGFVLGKVKTQSVPALLSHQSNQLGMLHTEDVLFDLHVEAT